MSRYRKSNRLITIDGEEKTLIEWSEETGISRQLIQDRINRGWDAELACYKEPRKYGSKKADEPTAD